MNKISQVKTTIILNWSVSAVSLPFHRLTPFHRWVWVGAIFTTKQHVIILETKGLLRIGTSLLLIPKLSLLCLSNYQNKDKMSFLFMVKMIAANNKQRKPRQAMISNWKSTHLPYYVALLLLTNWIEQCLEC